MEGNRAERMTRRKMLEAKKKEIIDHHVNTFTKEAIGVHKQELPKFAENLQEYWKLSDRYCERPPINSAMLLHKLQKHWAKLDVLHLSDVKDEPAPPDPFKTVYVAKEPKDRSVAAKVQELNHFKNPFKDESSEKREPRLVIPRWTEMQKPLQKSCEENPALRESAIRFEQRPLPSSFNANGIFQDPLDLAKQRYIVS